MSFAIIWPHMRRESAYSMVGMLTVSWSTAIMDRVAGVADVNLDEASLRA